MKWEDCNYFLADIKGTIWLLSSWKNMIHREYEIV